MPIDQETETCWIDQKIDSHLQFSRARGQPLHAGPPLRELWLVRGRGAGEFYDPRLCLVPGCRVIRTGEYGQEYELSKEVMEGGLFAYEACL